MKVLHTVEFYAPSVGGAQEVVRRVSEGLARRGHKVTVATSRLSGRSGRTISGVSVEEFEVSGNAAGGYRGEAERYQRFLLDGHFDVMMNYAAQQWATDLALPLLDRLGRGKLLATCGFSGLFDPRFAAYYAQLPETLRLYDHLILHSASYRDAEFARRHGLTRCTVIPNGAAAEEFDSADPTFRRRRGIPADVPLLLTVGSHTGLKGHRLVIDAFRRARIGPSVLVIVGNSVGGDGCRGACALRAGLVRALSLGGKRVLMLDPPRSEVVAAYHAADLFVFGSQVECSPLVLFEAMASRTPFVTVDCGNAREIGEWGRGGIVIPADRRGDGRVEGEPGVLARAIEDLVADPERRRRLGESGQQAWRQRFTWEGLTLRYEALYREVAERRAGRHVG